MIDEELEEARRLRNAVEALPFPANLGAFIDELADEMGDAVAANFFEGGETVTYRDMARRTRLHWLNVRGGSPRLRQCLLHYPDRVQNSENSA